MNRFSYRSLVIAAIGALALVSACGESTEITGGQPPTPPGPGLDTPATGEAPAVTAQAPPITVTTPTSPVTPPSIYPPLDHPVPTVTIPTLPPPPNTVPHTGPPATIPAGGIDIWERIPADQQAILQRSRVPVFLPTLLPGADETTRVDVSTSGPFLDANYRIFHFTSLIETLIFDAVEIVPDSAWAVQVDEWITQPPDLQGTVRGYQATDTLLIECRTPGDPGYDPSSPDFYEQGALWWADPTGPGYVYEIRVSPVPGCSEGRYTIDDIVRMADSVIRPPQLDQTAS